MPRMNSLAAAVYACASTATVKTDASLPSHAETKEFGLQLEAHVFLSSLSFGGATMTRDGVAVHISDESCEAFGQTIRLLQQDQQIAERCAVETVRAEALKCVYGAARMAQAGQLSQQKANALAGSLRRRLRGPYEQREYLAFVPGLALRAPLRVGIAELRPLGTHEDVKELCRWLADQQRWPAWDEVHRRLGLPRRRARGIQQARAALMPLPRSVAVASMHLALERAKAFETAEEAIQDALDLLGFFGLDLHEAPGELPAQVWGQVPGYGAPPAWINVLRSAGCRVLFPRRTVSRSITKTALRKMETLGFGWASAALAKRSIDRSPLERGVLLAIKWIVEGTADYSAASKVVKNVLAMETLLLAGRDRPVASTLAERLALLLGKNKSHRIEIDRVAKRLYRVRSQVVHRGEDSEMRDLLFPSWILAREAVTAAIRRARQLNWHSTEDIAAWVANRKYR